MDNILKKYYRCVINSHLDECLSSELHEPRKQWIAQCFHDEFDQRQCELPAVIMFDPCNQHNVAMPECTTCGTLCVTDFAESRYKTRFVIHTQRTILIQPTYRCPHNSLHDKGYTYSIVPGGSAFYNGDSIPIYIKNNYPFAITHRTAIATKTADWIFNNHQTILSLNKTEEIIRKQTIDNIQKKKLNLLYRIRNSGQNLPSDWNCAVVPDKDLSHERRKFLRTIVIDEYRSKREYWRYRKRVLTHDGTIRVDHSHKSAYKCKNAQGDRMFDGIYTIMNAVDVLCVRLCINKEQKEIEDLHVYVQNIKPVEVVLTDQCCKDRPMVQRIHGPNCKCLLDVYHAIARPMKHMLKTNPIFKPA
eukprot:876780_1